MRKIYNKLKSHDGFTEIISAIFVLVVLIAFLSYSLTMYGEVSKIDDLQQMAQQMARSIALEGELNSKVNGRLSALEDSMGLDVTMNVEGDYISEKKLRTESDFKVILTYESSYSFGGVINQKKSKTYKGVANGTVEEYHKGG